MPAVKKKPLSKQARYSRKRTAESAEIGPPPITAKQLAEGKRLWKLCKNSLENFNTLVFPNSTGLKPLGDIQKDSIAHDQSVIRFGGRICKAEPRGFGKTTRTCNAALWAVLFGYRRMVPVFSANLTKSKDQIMDGWRTEIINNERLFWMFPKLLWPLKALEGKPQRAASQTMDGKPTDVRWTAGKIVFPFVKGVVGSGAVLLALPLESARGANHKMKNGTVLRPELVIFDDVQKDEDADNPNTIFKLEELIDHSAMLLGGHSQTMSAIMNCTVRRADDLSEKYLKKSSWRRVRYKMLKERARLEKEFWLGEYARVRTTYDPDDPEDQRRAHLEALKLYKRRRAEADEGAVVTWEWAYAWNDKEPTEISAIQHAYNKLIDDGPDVFASECQNEPLRDSGGLPLLNVDAICKKQSAFGRGEFPETCTTLVAMVDVHPEILYWVEWALAPGFDAYLIDYGTFPDQGRRHFRHTMLARKLSHLFPQRTVSATIDAGIDGLLHGCDEEPNWAGLMIRQRLRADGVPLKITQCFHDANGDEADTIREALRRSPFSGSLTPSYGKYIGAKDPPMSQYSNFDPSCGPAWMPTKPKLGQVQGVVFDANFWKTRLHRKLAMPPGTKGAIYLYRHSDPEHHRMIAEHFRAERPIEVTVGSRTVYEFQPPGPRDNHFFDCAVGGLVAGSKMKISDTPPKVQRTHIKTPAEWAALARRR